MYKALPRYTRWVFMLLLLLNLGSKTFISLRPVAAIDGKLLPDDTYLALHISRSIAEGKGPYYGDNYTNGFQPLYVAMAVPFYWIFPGEKDAPVHAALLMLAVADTVSLLLLVLLLSRFRVHFLMVSALALTWIFNPFMIKNALNGLESGLALCSIAFITFFLVRNEQENSLFSPRKFFFLGLLFGLAYLARIDSLLLIPLVFIYLHIKFRKAFITTFRYSCLALAGFSLVILPWLIYSLYYTGDWYPISGKAVRFICLINVDLHPSWNNWYAPMLKEAWIAFSAYQKPVFFLLLPLIPFGCWAAWKRKIPVPAVFWWISLGCICLYFLAYVFYIFTPWYFYRYFYPFGFFLLLWAGIAAQGCYEMVRKRSLYWIISLSWILFWGYRSDTRKELQAIFVEAENPYLGYRNLGIWADQYFSPHTIIGGAQSGALGYYADRLKVINLDGVVNKDCYRSLLEKENTQYISAQQIDYIIGWKENLELVRKCSKDFSEDFWTREFVIEDFASWHQEWIIMKVNREE